MSKLTPGETILPTVINNASNPRARSKPMASKLCVSVSLIPLFLIGFLLLQQQIQLVVVREEKAMKGTVMNMANVLRIMNNRIAQVEAGIESIIEDTDAEEYYETGKEQNFDDAYFNPSIITNESGKGEFSSVQNEWELEEYETLVPDNNTVSDEVSIVTDIVSGTTAVDFHRLGNNNISSTNPVIKVTSEHTQQLITDEYPNMI